MLNKYYDLATSFYEYGECVAVSVCGGGGTAAGCLCLNCSQRVCPATPPRPPGWGTSFHFAHRYKHETHNESIRRHEHYLALRLGLKPGV